MPIHDHVAIDQRLIPGWNYRYVMIEPPLLTYKVCPNQQLSSPFS